MSNRIRTDLAFYGAEGTRRWHNTKWHVYSCVTTVLPPLDALMTCLAILPTSDMSHAWKMAGPLRMWSLPMRHCLWDFPQRFTLNMPWSLYRWIPLTIYATELEWANSTVVFFGLTYGRRGIQSFMTAITSYLGSLYGNGYFFWIFDRIPPALVFCLVFFGGYYWQFLLSSSIS